MVGEAGEMLSQDTLGSTQKHMKQNNDLGEAFCAQSQHWDTGIRGCIQSQEALTAFRTGRAPLGCSSTGI